MKKTRILLTAIASIALMNMSIAQSSFENEIKKVGAEMPKYTGLSIDKKPDKDTLTVENVKFIKVGDRVFSMEQLTQSIPLFVSLDWIAGLYGFIQTSKNGEFASKDIDQLKIPLIPYIQYLENQRQAQQSKTKN